MNFNIIWDNSHSEIELIHVLVRSDGYSWLFTIANILTDDELARAFELNNQIHASLQGHLLGYPRTFLFAVC